MRKSVLLLVAALLALLAVVPAFAQDEQTIPELLANDEEGRFTTLLAAVEAADLVETLSGDGPFTLIAPTNDAFDAALSYLGLTADELLSDTETLTDVLLYHVIPGENFFRSLTGGATVDTALEGETITFELVDGVLTANGRVEIRDVDNNASNGVVHVAEGVLLPTALQEAAAANRAHIRVAHLSPDAGAVDIYLNGELTEFAGVEFGTVGPWVEVAASTYRVGIAVAGGDPTENAISRVEAGEWITIAAVGTRANRAFDIVFLAEDHTPIPENVARIHVFHGALGYGAVDVLANGSLLVANLAYPGFYGNNDGLDVRDVSAGTYEIDVTATGTTTPAVLERTLALNSGGNYLVAVAGVVGNPQLIVAETAPAAEETTEDS